jgi:hypothetical protein
MNKIAFAGITVFAALGLLSCGLTGFVLFINFWNGDRTLAKNLTVSNEWAEINIDPPVIPTYREQAIYLRPVNFKVNRDAKSFEIRLPDGSMVEPEVEMFDVYGNRVQLHHSGFAMGWHDEIEFTPGSDSKHPMDLPRNRGFMKLRIRSDMPFVCERIYWIDYDPE